MESITLDTWKAKQTAALAGGLPNKVEQQHKTGKLTARERIKHLLDPESFEEVDQLAISPILEHKEYTDGVITGFGTVNGHHVALYAQDFTIKGGSLGKRHAEKICKIMDLAAKIGCPIIGIIDSGGARIDEGIHALAGYGTIFMRNCRYSGIIPQLSVILGPCAGGATYSPALTDFIFTTADISNLFITGPQVIEQVLHQTITKQELGGAQVHYEKSGVAHFIAASERECFAQVKKLLSYLPANYLTQPPTNDFDKTLQTPQNNPTNIVPTNFNQSYDMHQVINSIVDTESFFELQAAFAANMITGFARMEGKTVGIVANQPLVKAGTIDIDASCKAARFIRFCDSFDIPIVSLVDVPGFLPGIEQEHNGIIRHGAKLIYAYATATVPKITIILRKAFGGAYIVMGSKELGADFNFAWPQAHLAVLGAKGAVAILHSKELAHYDSLEKELKQQEFETNYEMTYLNPFIAAQSGYIDAIIEPTETRNHLIKTLTITENKVEQLPKRKHGNVPL